MYPLLSDSRKDMSMHRRFPSRRLPNRRPAGLGLANLLVAAVLGVIVYRKGVEEGKKLAESQRPG